MQHLQWTQVLNIRAIDAKGVSNRNSETSPGNQKVGCKQELYEQPE